MPNNSDDQIPERGKRSTPDPVRRNEPEDQSDSDSQTQAQGQEQPPPENQTAPRHGETVDLSNDEVEEETHHSDVPIDPEVQKEIDRYYEQKRQEEQAQEAQQEAEAEQEDFGNVDESPDPIQGGTDFESSSQPQTETEPDPREYAQEGHESGAETSQPDPSPGPQQESSAQQEPVQDPREPRESMVSEAGEEVDVDDIDLDSIENQEWGLGEARPAQIRKLRGMKFLLTEPEDDDTVVNAIQQIRQDDMMTAYYQLARITVKAPTITEERWTEGMTATERIALGNQVLSYLQAQDF